MSSHPISNPSIRRARDLSHRQAAAALLEKLKESEPDLEVRHVRLWDETLQMDYRLEHAPRLNLLMGTVFGGPTSLILRNQSLTQTQPGHYS